jgi:hypothetical protein
VKSLDTKAVERRMGAWLPTAVAVIMTVAPPPALVTAQAEDGAGVQAKDRDGADPKVEDPAEVQRRLQIKQQATHWERLLTATFYGDLELIRSVCGELPKDARRAIVEAGEMAVKKGALRLAELQFGGGRQVAEKASDDPVSLVSAALEKSLAERVGGDQAAAFARQIAGRDDRRKVSTVHNIVAVLDNELYLTAAQREQIERSLLEACDDSMAVALSLSLEGTHFFDGERVFPGLPFDRISPHLTEAQRKRFAPQEKSSTPLVPGRRAWLRMNVLNSVQQVARDPWWFE